MAAEKKAEAEGCVWGGRLIKMLGGLRPVGSRPGYKVRGGVCSRRSRPLLSPRRQVTRALCMPPRRAPPYMFACSPTAPRAAGRQGAGPKRRERRGHGFSPPPSRPGRSGGGVVISACALHSLPPHPPPVPGAARDRGGAGCPVAVERFCVFRGLSLWKEGRCSGRAARPRWRARRLGERVCAPGAGSGVRPVASRENPRVFSWPLGALPQPELSDCVPRPLPVSQGELARLVCTSAGRF